jgi:hypothetical protein
MTYQDLLRAANGNASKAYDLARLALLPGFCLPNRDDYRRARAALQATPADAVPGWLFAVRPRVLKRWSTRAAAEGIPRTKRFTGPRLVAHRTQRRGPR